MATNSILLSRNNAKQALAILHDQLGKPMHKDKRKSYVQYKWAGSMRSGTLKTAHKALESAAIKHQYTTSGYGGGTSGFIVIHIPHESMQDLFNSWNDNVKEDRREYEVQDFIFGYELTEQQAKELYEIVQAHHWW